MRRVFEVRQSHSGSQPGFWASWRGYYPLRYVATSSHGLVLQSGRQILPQGSCCFWKGMLVFMLLVYFVLNLIQEGECAAPKGFPVGSDVFIYGSLTILIVGLHRKSAKSLCCAGPMCFLLLVDWAGVGVGGGGVGVWCFLSILATNSPWNYSTTSHILEILVPRKRKQRALASHQTSYAEAPLFFLARFCNVGSFSRTLVSASL